VSIQPNPSAPLWPAEWQGCRITGQFIDFLGQPVAGTVNLTPTAAVVIAGTSKKIAVGSSISIDLDINGAFDITVPATDDPQTNPTGWTYSVVEGFPGGRSYSIDAPMNATRDLTAIVEVPSANGQTVLSGPAGVQIVAHGTNAATARPVGVPVVYWQGTARPTNALATDWWYNA